jgi:hypothetical protein
VEKHSTVPAMSVFVHGRLAVQNILFQTSGCLLRTATVKGSDTITKICFMMVKSYSVTGIFYSC